MLGFCIHLFHVSHPAQEQALRNLFFGQEVTASSEKEMEALSWELWEIDSKLSPRVKYYVLQMGVTVFEEADLVFCRSTSQKMKRKTSLLALQDPGAAFASFPDHVSDIPWCLLRCPHSLHEQR